MLNEEQRKEQAEAERLWWEGSFTDDQLNQVYKSLGLEIIFLKEKFLFDKVDND